MSRFRDALAAPGLGAIAEVKRRSPSAGDLRPDADPARLAAQFANAGAVAVSILVDDQFGGSLDDLKAARAATAAPLLAKGFFTEELDLLKLKLAGADAALILLRDVDDARAASLISYAGELGIETQQSQTRSRSSTSSWPSRATTANTPSGHCERKSPRKKRGHAIVCTTRQCGKR